MALSFPLTMAKILIVSGLRVFPNTSGGHLRTGNLARAFARLGHRVVLYSLAGRASDYSFHPSRRISMLHERIEPNLLEITNLGLGFGLSQALARRLSLPRIWQYVYLRLGFVPGSLRRELQDAEVVFSDLPWCPPVGRWYRRRPWYLISHNVEHHLLQQGGFVERLFAPWMRRVEERAPQLYADILSCADSDRDFFLAHDSRHRILAPIVRNGVDPAAYRAAPEVRARMREQLGLGDQDLLLVFSGSNFGPNVEALERMRQFCRREESFLRQTRIHILALGSMASEGFREGALIVTGRVPEVLPYFAAGDAGLNPVTRGSGSNLKLFEYVAARLPILSTEFGVRGTGLITGQDYLPFEDDTLRATLERFASPGMSEQWRSMASAVWTRRRNEFDMEAIVRDMLERLPRLAGELGI